MIGFTSDDLRCDGPPAKQRTLSSHLGSKEIPLVIMLDAGTAPTVVSGAVLVSIVLAVGWKQVQNFAVFAVRPAIAVAGTITRAGASQ